MEGDDSDISRAFFDAAPDAVVAVDADGCIVEANARVTVLLGYDPADLVGQAMEILLPERSRARHVAHRAVFGAQPVSRSMGAGLDLWARRKDGSELPVDVSLNPTALGHVRWCWRRSAT